MSQLIVLLFGKEMFKRKDKFMNRVNIYYFMTITQITKRAILRQQVYKPHLRKQSYSSYLKCEGLCWAKEANYQSNNYYAHE